jgi:hypothetical protein
VLIGSGIDTAALTKELEACKEDAPHADEHSMWGVLRYVQDSHVQDRYVQDRYVQDIHVQDEEPDGLEETG